MPQGLSYGEPHPHVLHAQNMVVAPSGRTGTLCHPHGEILKGAGNEKQHSQTLATNITIEGSITPLAFSAILLIPAKYFHGPAKCQYGLLHYERGANTYYVPASPRRSLEGTTNMDRPI